MYMIRPALRASTGRAPARIVHGRRYPSITRLRTFHSTQYVAQAANPPSTPDNTPIDTNGANKEDRENNAAAGAAEEQPDGVAAEDPEILAQKLQRSREMTRRYSSALRRSQRRNRPQGLPPVHVPDWFLKRRVVRRKDLPPDLQKRVKPRDLSLLLTHPESGERAVCPIPTSRDFEAARMVARLTRALWRRGLSDEEKKKVERIFDGKDQSKETASVLEDVEGGKEAADTGFNRLSESSAVEGARTDSTKDIEAAVQETEGLRETQTKEPKEGKAAEYYRKREAAKLRIQQTRQRRLSPLVLAEIRATIAASLSAVRPSIGDPFPSAKTNVILHSPSTEQEKLLQRTVQAFAHELGADLVVLEAHDLAQIGGDYLGAGSEPFPHSIRTLGYETYRLNSELPEAYDDIDKDDANGEEVEAQPNHQTGGIEARFDISLNLLRAMSKAFKSPVVHLPAFAQVETEPSGSNQQSPRSQSQSEIQLEDLKISSLLEALIDADEAKESRGLVGVDGLLASTSTASTSQNGKSKNPDFFDYSMGNEVAELDFNSALPVNARPGISLSVAVGPSEASHRLRQKSKIIYIKDIKELNATQYGGRIIQKLEELVRKRRGAGESIMIVGSTGSNDLTPELSPNGVRGLQSEGETDFWRTIVVATEVFKDPAKDEIHANIESERGRYVASPAQQRKFRLINLMHIQDMLRGLDPVASVKIADMERSFEFSRSFSSIIPESSFYRVLTYDEIHRIALTALGLHVMNPGDGHLNWAHVALAMGLLKASDLVKFMDFTKTAENIERGKLERLKPWDAKVKTDRGAEKESNKSSPQARSDLQRVAASATKHEKRLMPGIANPDQIKTTFDQVHVPKETIDSIRTITSLSLLRPDAFNYGILATEKISGALLYGPPGTGKTLLAKAVAKESGSAVLEVSGSQIMDKYVGEGEKNVAAIFSLARKLSPCIVFLDEADAIFASRDAARDRSSHRDILNQFLKEWDGLNDLSVFVMVATNRPFDLDDAVIRRLPRRLLVDLPTQVDRQEIFRIHLRGEQLDESVDLEDLAKRTPFYSGSDIKNVAVSAALACVKEENEQAAMAAVRAAVESQEAPDTISASSSTPSTTSNASQPAGNVPPVPQLGPDIKYKFPEKRILHARHFDKALQEISASISEDMSSLTAIRKFDEQYGDRKSKKKRDFGFGMKVESNENAARVRT